VIEALNTNWKLNVDALTFVPKGAGAHHWLATAGDGRRWFVTGDDLDTKPWFGPDRESVLLGLNAAYGAANNLRESGGLTFVVAPVPTRAGEPTVRLDARHTVTVLPFVDGASGQWGESLDPAEHQQLLELLAALHAAGSGVHAPTRLSPAIAGRWHLETALEQLHRSWGGGPYSELLHGELLRTRELVTTWLDEFDEMKTRLPAAPFPPFVTHGEPHPANLIRTTDGLVLIDWDTIAMDRAERDLWMLDDGTGSAVAIYEELTGRTVDRLALTVYRRAWALSDLAIIISQLRRPHADDADTKRSWDSLIKILRCEEPCPFGGGTEG